MASKYNNVPSELPIAIVGLSCRLPGASDPGEFWQLLKSGIDAVGEVPRDRWDVDYFYHPEIGQLGKMYTRAGGYLRDIDKFDAEFFGISPREAGQMDPQQRLSLELAWEAFESAGIVPAALAGSDTSVFMGVSAHDYAALQREEGDCSDPHMMSGTALSIVANRISYIFDLHGASVVVDTACSSSLVAVHQACESLRRGDSSIAIAGGVNVLLSPWGGVGFSRAMMLSPTGRCRAFDARGDGYVRSEGGGVVILKPLHAALADKDPIRAVILSSGVNSDGRTKGISLPNPVAQEQLLRQVYTRAAIDPASVSYIEAHGTGTSAGDPVECTALGQVIGKARSKEQPCPIGSVKTNIGHLEAGSGIAGLLKAVLSLEHREIPASLHFKTPNPNIAFADLNLKVVTEHTVLRQAEQPLVIGVNSFGFGGTNAHVVVKEYAGQSEESIPALDRIRPLMISARSTAALKALADRYARLLQEQPGATANICRSAVLHRSQHPNRLAVFGRSGAEIAANLAAFVEGSAGRSIAVGLAPPAPARVAFVFSGNGSQWHGMGRELLAREPVFAECVARIDRVLAPLVGWSVTDALRSEEPADAFDRTEVAQPALFAVQAGIVEWLRAHGVVGDAFTGHSVGEIAAAYCAGILSLEQACLVVARRSEAQGKTAGTGKMAAVGLSAEQAATLLKSHDQRLTIASINSRDSVTLAGPEAALQSIGEELRSQGVFFRMLALDYAFHSAAMDPIREEVLTKLAGLAPHAATSRFVSTVTGEDEAGLGLGADYWWDNIRQPVQFVKAIERLIGDGITALVEIGPHSVLTGYLRTCLAAAEVSGAAIGTMRRREAEIDALWAALGQCYTAGIAIDWPSLFPGQDSRADLPAYPWQRERHFLSRRERVPASAYGPRQHPLLGYRLPTAEPTWENRLETWLLNYLPDHVIQGSVVFPAAGYIEMALAAGKLQFGTDALEIEGLGIRRPIVFQAEAPPLVESVLSIEDNSFRVTLRDGPLARPSLVAVGRVTTLAAAPAEPAVSIEGLRRRLGRVVEADAHYRNCAEHGLAYGPSFRGVARIWSGPDEALGQISVPEIIAGDLDRYCLHPAILDACLHVTFGAVAHDGGTTDQASYLPIAFERIRLHDSGIAPAWCHVVLRVSSRRSILADLVLLDAAGRRIGEIVGLRLRRLESAGMAAVPAYHWHSELRANAFLRRQTTALDVGMLFDKGAIDGAFDAGAAANRAALRAMAPALDRLAVAYVWRAVCQLGGEEGDLAPAALIERGGVQSDRVHYFRSLLKLLERRDIVGRVENRWISKRENLPEQPDKVWQGLVNEFPSCLASLYLIGRCGDLLIPYLRGIADPVDLAGSTHDSAFIEQFYESDPAFRNRNDRVAAIVRKLVQGQADGVPLRILEVGGGTGALTQVLLPILPADRTEYVFSAADAETVSAAGTKFESFPFVRTALLDVDRDPAIQGFAAAEFDIVLVTDTLYAASDLRTALANIRLVLKAGGLLLLPGVAMSDRLAFMFGMSPSWWAFTDIDLRPEAPLLPASRWRDLLEGAGFDKTTTAPAAAGPDGEDWLILARNSSSVGKGLDSHHVTAQRWLVLTDRSEGLASGDDLALNLSRGLTASDQRVVTVHAGHRFERLGPDRAVAPLGDDEAYRSLLQPALSATPAAPYNLVLVCTPSRAKRADLADPMPAQQFSLALIRLYQIAGEIGVLPSLRLFLVTTGAMAAPGYGPADPAQAPLWGVARTMMNERPDFTCRLIDVDPRDDDESNVAALLAEILHPDEEDEVVLSRGGRYVRRVRPGLPPPVVEQGGTRAPEFKLAFRTIGGQERLALQAIEPPSPGAGEVLIRVRAGGLNYRDVLQRSSILPEEAFEGGFAGATLGMEFAGQVAAVGPGVTDVNAGDEVFGFASAALSSLVVAKTSAVFRKPAAVSFADAATMPVAMITALYSLEHLARLQQGESILIHGAAGGVGLAAIQYAQSVGAKIFATAGTPEKREFLRRLGVYCVLDSRSLGFGDEIRKHNGGEGVDVVLNSIAGEAIHKGIAILRPYGRFVELGKRDFYANTKLGLHPFRNNVQFFGVDIDRLLVDRPDLAQQVFARLSALMTTGALRPLVNRVFPVTRAAEAFWHMQQSRHIGKVVLSFDEGAAGVEHPTAEQLQLPQAATYLITGGRSGFGLATAEWLAAKGARHLVLIGRRADTEPDAAKILDRLRAQGVEIREVALDVTDGDALAALLQTVRRDMPPLRGVVHCAAIIADAAIGNMSREQFETVLRPKMLGAWNLHRVTQDLSLDFFILYSSAVTLIGNPGQSNYMAANLYLEALAQYRRALKQPALAVMWGAISEVGHLTRHADVAKMMTERLGVIPIAPRRALAGMEQAMLAGASEVAIAELSWQKLTKLPRIAAAPKYSSVRDQFGGVSDDDTADASQQLDLLAAMPEAEAEQIVVQMITTQVAEVMRISAAKLDANKSLNDLGMDSLMVVELNMLFEQKFGLAIPTLELMDMATITKLSRRITGQIRARSGLASDGGPAVLDGVDVDTLPDEALDEVLGDLLERELDRKVVEGIQ